jgi:DNA topoisomerase-1
MPPKMFNQASIVRELKKLGIGRPSTYAPILTKLQEREYVAYKKGKPIEVNEKGY